MLEKIINMEETFSQMIRTGVFSGKCSFSTTPSPTAAYHVVMYLIVESAGAVLHDAYKWKNCSMREKFGITPAVKMFTPHPSPSTPKMCNRDSAWV